MDAEDLVQEAFVHLSQAADRVEEPERIYGYLWQVTLRRSYNLVRKRIRSRRIVEEATHLLSSASFDPTMTEPSDLLSLLDTRDGTLLVRRYWEGFTLEQLAEAEGVSLSTLKRRLRRATAGAKRLMDPSSLQSPEQR